jgi:hypothetical protein
MKPEERILKFISDLIGLIIENMWGFIFLVWVATSVFSLDELVMVKKEPTPTQIEKKNDGPTPGF